jgi:hypothetical protein
VQEGIWKDNEFLYAKKIEPDTQTKSNEVLQAASGTAFVVSKEGHIVTNHHVIEGCAEVKVHKDGDVYKGKVIANDIMNITIFMNFYFSTPFYDMMVGDYMTFFGYHKSCS